MVANGLVCRSAAGYLYNGRSACLIWASVLQAWCRSTPHCLLCIVVSKPIDRFSKTLHTISEQHSYTFASGNGRILHRETVQCFCHRGSDNAQTSGCFAKRLPSDDSSITGRQSKSSVAPHHAVSTLKLASRFRTPHSPNQADGKVVRPRKAPRAALLAVIHGGPRSGTVLA